MSPSSQPHVRLRFGSAAPPHKNVFWLVDVEVARGAEAQMRGLAGRDALGDEQGMLFPQVHSVWMKGMRAALDLVFLHRSRRAGGQFYVVGRVFPSVPTTSTAVYTDPLASAVLEVAAGWCARHGVAPGHMVQVIA